MAQSLLVSLSLWVAELVGGSQSSSCAQLTADSELAGGSELAYGFERACYSQLVCGSEFAYNSKQLTGGSELVTLNLLVAQSL